jgi:hypothetical protein
VFGFKLNGLKEEILGFSEFSFADFIVGREEEIISVSVGEDVGHSIRVKNELIRFIYFSKVVMSS